MMYARMARWSQGITKRLTFGAVVVTGTAILCLAAVEMALRLTGVDNEPVVYDPNIVQTMATAEYAYTLRTNSLGLRDRDYAPAKPEGVYRILMLGDSFILGQGVEVTETCCEILEKELNRGQWRGRFEVINAGKVGYGPETYLSILRSLGKRLRPDLVVIGFTAGNDVNDVRNPYLAQATGEARARSGSRVKSAMRTVFPKTYWFLLKRYYIIWRKIRPPANEIGKRDPNNLPNPLNDEILMARARAEGVSDEMVKARAAQTDPEVWHDALELRVNPYLLRDALIRPQIVCDSLRLQSHGMKDAWEATKKILRETFETAGSLGSRVAVMAIPAQHQVSRGYWAYREKLGYELDESLLREARVQDALRSFCSECGVPMVDLLPAFRNSSSNRLYYPKDEHWTVEGHRLAADEMRAFLASQELVPRD